MPAAPAASPHRTHHHPTLLHRGGGLWTEGTMGMLKGLLAASAAVAALGLWSPAAAQDVEWPTYTADLAGSRYRPLDQINAGNFSKLEVAWRFKTDAIGNRPEFKLEGTPLMVGGVVY